MAQRKAAAEKQYSVARVASALAPAKYAFSEEHAGWRESPWASMSEEDQAAAKEAWRKADFTPVSGSVGADEEEAAENEDIEKAMVAFMRKRFKWSTPVTRAAWMAQTVGEIPQNALVTAEQAESALGRTVATELDVDISEAVDADTNEEEEVLAGRQVNPSDVDYSCLSWQPAAPDSVSAEAIGWEVGRAADRHHRGAHHDALL